MKTRDSAEIPKNRLLAAELQLLAEGLPSYLDAMMAIQELRQNVHKRCRRVLCEGLEEFGRAIGFTLDPAKIEDYAWPDGISALAIADMAWLGVKIPLQKAGTAYVTLLLEEDRQIYLYVAIELKVLDLYDRVSKIVQREEPRVDIDCRGTIELYKPAPPDHIPSFEGPLSDLMREWSALWQRVGVPLGSA